MRGAVDPGHDIQRGQLRLRTRSRRMSTKKNSRTPPPVISQMVVAVMSEHLDGNRRRMKRKAKMVEINKEQDGHTVT
jgi:hypothetical protein